jgi:membrane fusion protein, multidrug efflux system
MLTRDFRHPSWSAVLAALSFAALLVVTAFSGCARPQAQAAEAPPPQVTVAEALDREVTEWDDFTGRLEAVDSVAVRPRVTGFMSSVHFTEGAIVKKGQLLFQLDERPFQAVVDRLRAQLTRAQATVRRASSELDRAARLRAENAMSLEEHDRRTGFADESAAEVAAVAAALRAAELDLEFTRVIAPITGRIGRAIVTEGNLVNSGPGEPTLLATVVSMDPIYAYFDADEQFFLRYQAFTRTGQRKDARPPIRMALSSDDGFSRDGRLDFIDNQVDARTGTIRGRAVFANHDGALTPGLFVRLRLSGGGRYRGMLIQDRAVGTDLDKKFVYVVDAKQAIEYRPVTLGPLVDGLRVVRSGLRAGDRVVINGLQRIRPGVTVSPLVAAMDTAAAPVVAASAQ